MKEKISESVKAFMPHVKGLKDEQLSDLEAAIKHVRAGRRKRAETRKANKIKRRIAEIEAIIGNRRCHHPVVQTYTEWCLTCDHNIYDYNDELYLADLEKELAKRK